MLGRRRIVSRREENAPCDDTRSDFPLEVDKGRMKTCTVNKYGSDDNMNKAEVAE